MTGTTANSVPLTKTVQIFVGEQPKRAVKKFLTDRIGPENPHRI